MRRPVVLLGFLFLLGAGTVAYSFYSAGRQRKEREAELRALLETIDRAEATARYAGVRTTSFQSGTHSYTTTVKIRAAGDRRRIELVASDSRGERARKMPYFGGIPSSLRPGHGVRGRFHDPELILRNYAVRISGTRQVAGRAGDVIEIVSRHAGRPSYVVVADRANRFPLSFEVRNDAGARVLATEFESIEFNTVFPEDAAGGKRKRHESWIRVEETAVAAPEALPGTLPSLVWLPAEPPAGFRLMKSNVVRIATTRPILFGLTIDIRVLHLTYTDGMALFSIVEFARDSEVWKILRNWLPPVQTQGGIVARKFAFAAGMALLVEFEHTIVILAGNVSGAEIEECARTLAPTRG